ncbi:hypothetical protein C0992_010758 [Termitomyces sp. T32_za158]|nr:hypothetical protein C0992_010758 [Termitomyces sp. T32_za158]
MRGRLTAEFEDGRRIIGCVLYSVDRRFPSKTQGFLYYHRDPHLPPTTDEIRFRVTESSDPTYFHDGTDLMRADGALPWSISLIRLSAMHAPLKELLAQNHNIPAEILDHGRKSLLSYLEKPFVVTLEQWSCISLIDSQLRTEKVLVPILLHMPRKWSHSVYKGKLLVRFEQASLVEHKDDTSIVMRVLKVLEPIQPLVKDAALLQPTPEEGALLKTLKYGQIKTVIFKDSRFRRLPSLFGSSDVEIAKGPSTLSPDSRHFKRRLTYLEQPFVLDISQIYNTVCFILPEKVITRRLYAVFYNQTWKFNPYTGRLVVRFERSTLPEHSKGNFIVLRVLKILDPVKSIDPAYVGDFPVPIVGQLLMRTHVCVRSYNLDKIIALSGILDLPSIPDDEPDL